MKDILTSVEDAVASLLSQTPTEVTQDVILQTVRIISNAMSFNIPEDEIILVAKRLEERFDIRMSLGIMFAEDYIPWLDNTKGQIDWYYWNRYKRLLIQGGFSPHVVRSLDTITDQILDHLENPHKAGKWARKGMVVGHVQSGKTANYTALVNKAADSGYRVIIILAGTLNSLRNQTQIRLDGGFIGIDTSTKQPLGVGEISNLKKPAYFTTNTKDFKKAIANQIGVGIGDLREPVILVIKKNKSTLENLTDWLKHNNLHNLKDYPMLLIDDEADYASINTSKNGDAATTINRKIRELLVLFDRSSYLGYTATPFANVFIDPETENEMLGDDLFPRDFIISLDPPSNYIGPSRIFSSDADLDVVREVNDYEADLPLRHKINWQIDDIPASLKEAIKTFIIIRGLRLLRGQVNAHNSMMVNVSRFTNIQSKVKLLVDEYVKEILQAIIAHYRLSEAEALKSSIVSSMRDLYLKEFSNTGYSWLDLQGVLKDAVSPIGVIEVNISSSAEQLDYSRKNFPQGRNVIAIGGLSLSRGLTLEGLTVSYFLRNSIMYDTLMQMGRWFGYRDGYEDLCRIYMTSEAASWYAHISDVMDELRGEFTRMKSAGMSPRDFGLCVRSHPESLIVTARNKMRTGKNVSRRVSLDGRLVETSILLNKTDAIESNLKLLTSLVHQMLEISTPLVNQTSPSGYFWNTIPAQIIHDFINAYRNHPASQLTDAAPLTRYIGSLEKNGQNMWDVLLVSPSKGGEKYKTLHDTLKVYYQKRGVAISGNGIAVSKGKRRVGDAIQESAGLPIDKVKMAVEKYRQKYLHEHPDKKTANSIPGSVYRNLRSELHGNSLLILHLLDCEVEKGVSLFSEGILAYGISFPGDPGSRRPENLVEYVVNTTWWNTEYADILDDEEEIDDEQSLE